MKIDELAKLLDIPNLGSYLKQVEESLSDALNTNNKYLSGPAMRVVKGGGKRLRPVLVIAVAQALDKKFDQAVIASCTAVELIHIASLVHDDIIDKSPARRGVATINSKEGVDSAILVGDYLLALALAQAATVSKEAAYILATAFAVMCEGQSLELSDLYNVNRSIENYYKAIKGKSGALMSVACQLGGLCAGSSQRQNTTLANFGESFGTAFQLTDDLLDFVSTSTALGKPVGNDMKEGNYTLPLLFALHGPQNAIAKSWLGKKPVSKPDKNDVLTLLKRSGAIEKTLAEVRHHNKQARDAIIDIKSSKGIGGLSKLPEAYLEWALKQT